MVAWAQSNMDLSQLENEDSETWCDAPSNPRALEHENLGNTTPAVPPHNYLPIPVKFGYEPGRRFI